MIPSAIITTCFIGGRSVHRTGSGPAVSWLPASAIEDFAAQNHKAVRFLNRGSIVTATLIGAALRQRWPDREAPPPELTLLTGTGFGNQGETTRYFRLIRERGVTGVNPMQSLDVAVNSFANVATVFFGVTGIVHTMSSGAASGADILASALCLLDAGETEAVVAADCEYDSEEVYSYTGATESASPGDAEACGVLVLERARTDRKGCGVLLGAETAYANPGTKRAAQVLAALVARLLSSCQLKPSAISAVLAGPAWTRVFALARDVLSLPRASWLDGAGATTPWQLGAMGTVGCALILDHLHQSEPRDVGLVVTGDPGGWLGAVLLAADETR